MDKIIKLNKFTYWILSTSAAFLLQFLKKKVRNGTLAWNDQMNFSHVTLLTGRWWRHERLPPTRAAAPPPPLGELSITAAGRGFLRKRRRKVNQNQNQNHLTVSTGKAGNETQPARRRFTVSKLYLKYFWFKTSFRFSLRSEQNRGVLDGTIQFNGYSHQLTGFIACGCHGNCQLTSSSI